MNSSRRKEDHRRRFHCGVAVYEVSERLAHRVERNDGLDDFYVPF